MDYKKKHKICKESGNPFVKYKFKFYKINTNFTNISFRYSKTIVSWQWDHDTFYHHYSFLFFTFVFYNDYKLHSNPESHKGIPDGWKKMNDYNKLNLERFHKEDMEKRASIMRGEPQPSYVSK